jgi:hypothetical protein
MKIYIITFVGAIIGFTTALLMVRGSLKRLGE